MRDDQVSFLDALITEQKDVNVDYTRAPALCWYPATLALDGFGGAQQLTSGARPVNLHHLVEE